LKRKTRNSKFKREDFEDCKDKGQGNLLESRAKTCRHGKQKKEDRKIRRLHMRQHNRISRKSTENMEYNKLS
jgi:hypothetical protein